MSQLPPAILFDLDDTILSAFGQAEGQWRRVIAELKFFPNNSATTLKRQSIFP